MSDIPTDAAVTKEIEGLTYGTRHMAPDVLIEYAGGIMAMVGGAIPSSPAEGAQLLSSNMHLKYVKKLIDDMMALAMVNNKELGREKAFWKTHFLGKQKALVRVLAWLWEVHFADFFVESKIVVDEVTKRFSAGEESAEA